MSPPVPLVVETWGVWGCIKEVSAVVALAYGSLHWDSAERAAESRGQAEWVGEEGSA